MFKNIKEKMKNIGVFTLAALFLCTAGCGKNEEYDFASSDLSSYVTIPDLGVYTYETLLAEYEKARAESTDGTSESFVLQGGYSIDFYVTAYVKNGDSFERYEDFCYETFEEPVKDYFVLQNDMNSEFDKCLMANVSSAEEAAVSARTITNGKAFSFNIDIDSDCQNADIAGKTMRFVITPAAYKVPLFGDSDISSYCKEYFSDVSDKAAVEKGDAVFLSIVATSGGSAIYTNTDVFLFVGENTFFPGFDEWLVGKALGADTLSVTFGEDAFAAGSSLYAANGKTVEFYTNITKICETDGNFEGGEHFDSVWSMKEYCRLRLFAMDYLYSTVAGSVQVNSYPDAGYKMIRNEVTQEIDSYMEYYTEYLTGLLGEVTEEYVLQYAQKEAFGMEEYEPKDEFIETLTSSTIEYIIVNDALADSLGVEYTYEDYEADFKQMLLAAGDYETEISEAEQTVVGGRHYWYAYCVSSKVANALSQSVLK